MNFYIKICLFLLPLVLLEVYVHHPPEYANANFEKNSVFFVGSSRVQRGIITSRLEGENKIYNAGISGSTFFHNMIRAEYLIKEHKAQHLFIEISPIQYSFRRAHIPYGIHLNYSTVKAISLRNYADYIESYLFSFLSLKSYVKELFMAKAEIHRLGYIANEGSLYNKVNSFLKVEDLNKTYKYNITAYLNFINHLNQLAEKEGTRIQYFLPLTYKRQLEKEIDLAVFNSLESELKVTYTEDFLRSIMNSDYLYDMNHLNNKGATIMTNYFNSTVLSH